MFPVDPPTEEHAMSAQTQDAAAISGSSTNHSSRRRSGTVRTGPRRSWPLRLGHAALRTVAVLTILALVGSTLQALSERRDAAAHPPPGELVTLPDGRHLHLQVAGEDHDGPTVILEGGAGASSSAWGWIAPAVAEHATVVAYDRAGLGWSDTSPHQPSTDAALADLRDALTARGLAGPYLLVGHSLGAHHVRAFAAAHPDEVAGLVLVDPSHERAAEAVGMTSEQMWPMFAGLRAAARLGLLRLYNPFAGELETLPQPHRDQALTQLASTRYARTFGAEMAALDAIGATLPTGQGVLGDLPLRVLIGRGGATSADEQAQLDAMAALRGDMEQMSTDGHTITLDDATHVSIVADQRHAATVTDTIIDLLQAIR
jgi:pimeloyl-ACP methyl ester carboxylesterase